jgi:hypothetical protein
VAIGRLISKMEVLPYSSRCGVCNHHYSFVPDPACQCNVINPRNRLMDRPRRFSQRHASPTFPDAVDGDEAGAPGVNKLTHS